MLTRLFQTLAKFREIAVLGAALWLMQMALPIVVVLLAMLLFLLGIFTLVTGWGVPRFKGRWKGLGILFLSSIFFITAVTVHNEQQEERWAQLRLTDPDAYLAEVARADDDRWLNELSELRPEAYQAEITRREREAEEAAVRLAAEAEARRAAEEVKVAQGATTALQEPAHGNTSGRGGFTEADFYWDEDSTRYRAEIVKIVNRIAVENAKCPEPDPQSVMLSTSRSKPGAPIFFVTCGRGAGVFNLWFSPKDAASDREFLAVLPIARSVAADICEREARARATHPSTVKFSHFLHLAFMTYNSGRARVTSKFTARNAFNLELTYTIDCLFEVNGLLEVNIYES